MMMSQTPFLSLLNIILMTYISNSLDLYISSTAINDGDGTFLNPYQNFSQIFKNSAQNNLTIFILSNSLTYVIDTQLQINCTTSILFIGNNSQMAILDFYSSGSLKVNDYYSLRIENIILEQTNPQNYNIIMIQAINADCIVFKVKTKHFPMLFDFIEYFCEKHKK